MITPYMKPVLGGISSYLDGLCRGVREQETTCEVIAEKGESTLGTSRTDRSLLRFLTEGILAALSLRPDVLHVHSSWKGFLIALPFKLLSRQSALFFTFHTDSISPLSGFRKTVFEMMLSKCDGLIFTSSYLQSQTETSLSIKTRSRVILAGVSDVTVDHRQVEGLIERLSLRGKFPILLYMTPFVWEEKVSNIETLGKILQKLKTGNVDPVLVVIGDGPLRSEIERGIRRLGLDEIVVLPGRVDDIGAALAMCDIYTHISKKESLSMAILEAMSAGKPVIATEVGGTPEILSQKGLGVLVSQDLAGAEEAILMLTSNPDEMKAMGARARERVETGFTWRVSSGNHIELYKEALGGA
jgi:glycosyltransferase involved in cell wall biosynthesis